MPGGADRPLGPSYDEERIGQGEVTCLRATHRQVKERFVGPLARMMSGQGVERVGCRAKAGRYGGEAQVIVLGSAVRGQAREDSNVDLLVGFQCPMRLLEFIELKEYLKRSLGGRVDLSTPESLRVQFHKQLLQEVVYVG